MIYLLTSLASCQLQYTAIIEINKNIWSLHQFRWDRWRFFVICSCMRGTRAAI